MAQGESVRYQLTLVQASNEGSGVDGALKEFEGPLKRLFRYDSYFFQDRRTVSVAVGDQSSVRMKKGHNISLSSNSGSELKIVWNHGKKTILRTSIGIRGSKPAVLGGSSSRGEGAWLLIIQKK